MKKARKNPYNVDVLKKKKKSTYILSVFFKVINKPIFTPLYFFSEYSNNSELF